MLKKIVKPACNVNGSVEYILRGASKCGYSKKFKEVESE